MIDSLFNWLNPNSGAIQALTAICIVGLTIVLIIYNRKMAEANQKMLEENRKMAIINQELLEENRKITNETREQYKHSRRSVLSVSFISNSDKEDKNEDIYLLIEALGETMLKDIEIKFLPTLVNTLGLIEEISLIEETVKNIPILLPNRNITVRLVQRFKIAELSDDSVDIVFKYVDCFGEIHQGTIAIFLKKETMYSKSTNWKSLTLDYANNEKAVTKSVFNQILKR